MEGRYSTATFNGKLPGKKKVKV